MKLCVCQICVCGRHHCEKKKYQRLTIPHDTEGQVFKSETTKEYQNPGLQPRTQAVIPRSGVEWLDDGPMATTTTTRHDYPPKKVTPRKGRNVPAFKPPEVPMYTRTVYRDNFTGCWAEPIKAVKPTGEIEFEKGKMETKTTQNTFYVAWDPEDAKACRGRMIRNRGSLNVSGKEFKGESVTATSYLKPPPQERVIGRPKPSEMVTGGKFEGQSTTKSSYKPHVYEKPVRMLPRRGRVEIPKVPFEGTSTYETSFKNPGYTGRCADYNPRREFQPPSEPFEGRSRYQMDYLYNKPEPRTLPAWNPNNRKYHKPDVPMAGETTYSKEFVPPPEDSAPPPKAKGRLTTLAPGGEPMETTTTHQSQYRKYENIQRTLPCVPLNSVHTSSDKFGGESITQSHFIGKKGLPAVMSVPHSNFQPKEGAMEHVTTTNKDYQYKRFDCPAGRIKLGDKDTLSRFEYLDTCHGHEYYKTPKPFKAVQRTMSQSKVN